MTETNLFLELMPHIIGARLMNVIKNNIKHKNDNKYVDNIVINITGTDNDVIVEELHKIGEKIHRSCNTNTARNISGVLMFLVNSKINIQFHIESNVDDFNRDLLDVINAITA